MLMNTDQLKKFIQDFGFNIDFSDGEILLTAFKSFAEINKTSYSAEEKKILNEAFILIKKITEKQSDNFWKKYNYE
jgi:hypothetical protein